MCLKFKRMFKIDYQTAISQQLVEPKAQNRAHGHSIVAQTQYRNLARKLETHPNSLSPKLGFNPEPLLLRLALFLNNVQFLRSARGNQSPNFVWLKVPRLLNPIALPRTVQWRPYFNSSPSWNFSDSSIFNRCRYLRRR